MSRLKKFKQQPQRYWAYAIDHNNFCVIVACLDRDDCWEVRDRLKLGNNFKTVGSFKSLKTEREVRDSFHARQIQVVSALDRTAA